MGPLLGGLGLQPLCIQETSQWSAYTQLARGPSDVTVWPCDPEGCSVFGRRYWPSLLVKTFLACAVACVLHVRAYVADADPGSTSENVLPLKAIVLRDVDH